MLRLQTLIVERLITTKSIRRDIEDLVREALPIVGVETEFKINRAVLKYLSGLRRKERQRSSEEEGLLGDIKNLRFLSSKTIEDVYLASLAIFTTYDPSLHFFAGQQTTQKIKVLYLTFFEKYESKISARMIFKMLSHHLAESSPYILLGWVSEWSRSVLSQALQQSIEEEMTRHDQQMKRLNNLRCSYVPIIKEKVSPYANSTALPRSQSAIQAIFTNKESVFGLFLDQMMTYYKFLPLDLDLTFLKSMRKVHNSSNLLDKQENLQKAAQTLIESQNRHTREHINIYFCQCQQYLARHPNALRDITTLTKKQKRKNLSLSPQVKSPKLSKKHLRQQQYFQRVKSQSKQQVRQQIPNSNPKHNSFLLHPKTNLICFQSSQELVNKYKKQKQSKLFELPSIVQSNRILCENIRSSMLKNRQVNAFFAPINRSLMSNYQRGILKSFAIPSKPSQSPTLSIQRTQEKLNYSQPRMPSIKEHPSSTKQGSQRKKRKLMLQMLRDKNKRAFLE